MTPEEIAAARKTIESQVHGGICWDTVELQRDYNVHSFMAPFVTVTRKSDGVKGSMQFTHMPRFYFGFVAE